MTTFYIDYVHGLDTNNGLGPDASHATNKPWKSVSKMAPFGVVNSGDIVYLSPSGQHRGVVGWGGHVATSEIKILGDPWNAQGFKDASGVKVPPGEVIITNYLTDDNTAPTNTSPMNVSNHDWLTFQYITFLSGSNVACFVVSNGSTNCVIRDCKFISAYQNVIEVSVDFGGPANLLIERCVALSVLWSKMLRISAITGSAGADYDVGITMRNCIMVNGDLAQLTTTGGLTFKPGGCHIIACTAMRGGRTDIQVDVQTGWSTSIPCQVRNCILTSAFSTTLKAATLGQLVEDYNFLTSSTGVRTNVNVGANSRDNQIPSPLFYSGAGEETKWGARQHSHMEPYKSWPGRRYGHDASYTVSDDFFGRPRAANVAHRSWGALESGNVGVRETTVVQASGNSICLVGSGTQEFQVPVDATMTTLSVYLRYDSTYAGTRPQLQLLANPEIGVAEQTVTCTVAALNAWEKVSLTAFAPSAPGIVTVRVISNDTTVTGKTYADTFEVA